MSCTFKIVTGYFSKNITIKISKIAAKQDSLYVAISVDRAYESEVMAKIDEYSKHVSDANIVSVGALVLDFMDYFPNVSGAFFGNDWRLDFKNGKIKDGPSFKKYDHPNVKNPKIYSIYGFKNGSLGNIPELNHNAIMAGKHEVKILKGDIENLREFINQIIKFTMPDVSHFMPPDYIIHEKFYDSCIRTKTMDIKADVITSWASRNGFDGIVDALEDDMFAAFVIEHRDAIDFY